ncbi:MAG: hypothetical protein ABIH34_04625, partial [Nanoarchaeota archaeon]
MHEPVWESLSRKGRTKKDVLQYKVMCDRLTQDGKELFNHIIASYIRFALMSGYYHVKKPGTKKRPNRATKEENQYNMYNLLRELIGYDLWDCIGEVSKHYNLSRELKELDQSIIRRYDITLYWLLYAIHRLNITGGIRHPWRFVPSPRQSNLRIKAMFTSLPIHDYSARKYPLKKDFKYQGESLILIKST